ncbi:MAG: LysR substrate-binding domain-containing protein [Acetobacteraceae bacterium]
MDTLTGIKVFLQVVESGSFVAAADRLDVSTAMVSKHVMSVEQRLGVRLLNRNSRTLSLTEPGRIYFERCKVILDDLEETELQLGTLGSSPRGTLRITCPSWFASHLFATLLARYRAQFPEILLDISFEDRLVDLVEDGYDLALRMSPRLESLPAGLIARPVRPLPFLIAASRKYIERNGAPESPQDLPHHDCIAVGNMDSWVFVGPKGRSEVPARIVQRFRSMAGVPHAVAAGNGLAPLPMTLFEEPAFQDVLVPVLRDYPLWQTTLYLVYVTRKYMPFKIRSFIDSTIEFVAALDAPGAGEMVLPANTR